MSVGSIWIFGSLLLGGGLAGSDSCDPETNACGGPGGRSPLLIGAGFAFFASTG